MKQKSIRLQYATVDEVQAYDKARPCVAKPRGLTPVTPFRVVPVVPLIKNDCIGCVGGHSADGEVNCNDLPDCNNAIYVRATPANKLKHIEWLLDEYNQR